MLKWFFIFAAAWSMYFSYQVYASLNFHNDRAYIYIGRIERTSYVGSVTDRKNCDYLVNASNEKYPKGDRLICSDVMK